MAKRSSAAPRVTQSPRSVPTADPTPMQRQLWDALYDLSASVEKIACAAESELDWSAEAYSLRSTFRQIEGACDVARRVLEKSAAVVHGDRNPYGKLDRPSVSIGPVPKKTASQIVDQALEPRRNPRAKRFQDRRELEAACADLRRALDERRAARAAEGREED